jgi:hypothetical protein
MNLRKGVFHLFLNKVTENDKIKSFEDLKKDFIDKKNKIGEYLIMNRDKIETILKNLREEKDNKRYKYSQIRASENLKEKIFESKKFL